MIKNPCNCDGENIYHEKGSYGCVYRDQMIIHYDKKIPTQKEIDEHTVYVSNMMEFEH
jgi:hypothetical protein